MDNLFTVNTPQTVALYSARDVGEKLNVYLGPDLSMTPQGVSKVLVRAMNKAGDLVKASGRFVFVDKDGALDRWVRLAKLRRQKIEAEEWSYCRQWDIRDVAASDEGGE